MELKADSLHLQLLKLAKEGNGLIAPSAFISFSCRPVEPLSPVAFTSEESHVVSIFFTKLFPTTLVWFQHFKKNMLEI